MRLKNKKIFFGLLGFVFILVTLAFIPTAAPTADNVVKVTGIVKNLKVGGLKDIVFEMEGDDNVYYINRGEERALLMADLRSKLQHEAIDIYYIKHWSLLNPKGKVRSIAKVVHQDKVIFKKIH